MIGAAEDLARNEAAKADVKKQAAAEAILKMEQAEEKLTKEQKEAIRRLEEKQDKIIVEMQASAADRKTTHEEKVSAMNNAAAALKR